MEIPPACALCARDYPDIYRAKYEVFHDEAANKLELCHVVVRSPKQKSRLTCAVSLTLGFAIPDIDLERELCDAVRQKINDCAKVVLCAV